MVTFDITSRGDLTVEAKQLLAADSDAFDSYVIRAEKQLGLHAKTYTGDDLLQAKLALVRQVILLIAIDTDTLIKAMAVLGSETNVYKTGSPPEIDPVAAGIVRSLGLASPNRFQSVRRLK